MEDLTMRNLLKETMKAVRRYLDDPEHRREFERWYFVRYGEKYVWKEQINEKESYA